MEGAQKEGIDFELVRRFKAGDEGAFNEIVRMYQKKVYSLCYRMLGNKDDAGDVSQDVFVRAYKFLNKFDFRSSLYTWIYRIAVNLCINYSKRTKLTKVFQLGCADEGGIEIEDVRQDPEKDYERDVIRMEIEKAVLGLPPRQRAIFLMRHVEGLSHEEISKTINRSTGAVKANYFQAIRKLRKSLECLNDEV